MELMNIKKLVGEKAADLVQEGMTVGLGTGSTAYWAIMKLGERVKEGLRITAIATSKDSESLAKELKIPLVSFGEIDQIDLTIDGADEVDPNLNLIKGGGGALLREKIVAAASKKVVIIVDETKQVKQFGAFPLPVEVVPFGVESTKAKIEKLGFTVEIRRTEGNDRFTTDNGNLILDCAFDRIEHPESISQDLNGIPGVVENGLFIQMADIVYVGYGNGEIKSLEK